MANRQSMRSRKMMQQALLELLEERIYKKISITEICNRADLSRRTFYDHFDTKDDLLNSLVDDMLEPVFKSMKNMILTSIYNDEIEREYIEIFRQWKANDQSLKLIRDAGGDSSILQCLQKWFQDIYQNAVRPQLVDDRAQLGDLNIHMVIGAFFSMLTRWSDTGMKFPPELMGQYVFSIIGPPNIRKPFTHHVELFNFYLDEGIQS